VECADGADAIRLGPAPKGSTMRTGPYVRVSSGYFKEADVLGSTNAAATIAVKDIAVARRFYEDKLGLELSGTEGEGARAYRSGSSTILVYESRFAGTNQATAATWIVGDELEAIVRALKAKGVAFEHYDLPDTTRQGDVHVSGKTRVAWFKDPDGNILSIVNG
jgi:catechol 2,3-dioxygenase-like lactoylglutathione lyase family enzyme